MAEVKGRGIGFTADNPIRFKTVEKEKRYFRSLEVPWRIVHSKKVCSLPGESGVIDKYRVDMHEIIADGMFGDPDPNRYDYCYLYCDAHSEKNMSEPPNGFEFMEGLYNLEGSEKSSDEEKEYSMIILAQAFAGGDLETLESRLAEECTYTSEAGGVNLKGKDEIIGHIRHVHEVSERKQFCYYGEIVESDDELEHEVWDECLAIASGEEDNFVSIVFVDTDSCGLINKIVLTSDERYGVAIDGYVGNIGYYFIPTLNRRMFNIVNRENRKTERGLPLHVRCYFANVMDYINKASDFHIEPDSFFGLLNFMIDVSSGCYEEYSVSEEDPYRDVLKVMENINLAEKLTYEENLHVAFALYYAAFFRRESEETGRGVIRIDEFCYPENIDEAFRNMVAQNPEMFEVKENEIRCYEEDAGSAPEYDEDYGLIPEKPIELPDIPAEYWYLSQLYFEDGCPVEKGVQTAIMVENYPEIVDRIEILRDGEYVTDIYLYGYSKSFDIRNVVAPKGFMLIRG